MGSGRLSIYSNLAIQSTHFNLWGTGNVVIYSTGTLSFQPPYARSPVSTAYVEYGAVDTTQSPFPVIQNYGTLTFAATVRASFPLDSCVLYAAVSSNNTISATSPSCIIQQPYVDATLNPATTATLDGRFVLTSSGNVQFKGGSFVLSDGLNASTVANSNNYVKFGDKEDQNVLQDSANNGRGWTYLRVPLAITAGGTFWFDGTTYLTGQKFNVSKLIFSAGALHANVDIYSNFTVLENTASGTTLVQYIASNITILGGATGLFARSPSQYQEEQDAAPLMMRPWTTLTVSSGATLSVRFLPLRPVAALIGTGTAPRVLNQGTITFAQSEFPSFWYVFVDNRGNLRTSGSPRVGNSYDYAASLSMGGITTGLINFPGRVGLYLQGPWTVSTGATFTGLTTDVGAYLNWFPMAEFLAQEIPLSQKTLTFAANADLYSLETGSADGRIVTSGGARTVRVKHFLGSNTHSLCCSNSKFIIYDDSFFGTQLYRLVLNSVTLENQGNFTIRGAYVKSNSSNAYFINRSLMTVIDGGLNAEDGYPMHLINYGQLKVVSPGADFAGLVSNDTLEFVTDPAAVSGYGINGAA
jgi:hypothetical protein